MKRSKSEIKVITNYNGIRGDYIETISRMTRIVKNCEKSGRRRGPEYKVVNYKNNIYAVIALPESYGEIAGLCINVEDLG